MRKNRKDKEWIYWLYIIILIYINIYKIYIQYIYLIYIKVVTIFNIEIRIELWIYLESYYIFVGKTNCIFATILETNYCRKNLYKTVYHYN